MSEFLILARSGRALASSARWAGHNVHVMDCFVDEDTNLVSLSASQLQYHGDGFAEEELLEITQGFISSYPGVVVVVGSGFENNPDLLEKLSEFAPVLRNSKSTMSSLKDPISLSRMLDSNSIRHPEISLTRPVDSNNWLVKKVAGIGGTHVQWLDQVCSGIASDCYYQKYISGVVSSAVFLANGSHAKIVGFNQQLQSAQFTDMPFLYQGAVSVNNIDGQHKQRIEDVINTITTRTELTGLCGLDYIVDDAGEIYVIEVNPRPPSTFELHEQAPVLFDAHLACFDGKKIDCTFNNDKKQRGYAIYYAKQELRISNKIDWPSWVKDRPSFEAVIPVKFPVCTVHAEENSIEKVKTVLVKYLDYIESIITTMQHDALSL